MSQSEPANRFFEKDEEVASFKAAEKLYKAFIAPHFNYCAESWHFRSNRLTEKLEKLNTRALHFVYQDKISTYETLVVKNGYGTLANQKLAKMSNTVFGAIGNRNTPISFPSYWRHVILITIYVVMLF